MKMNRFLFPALLLSLPLLQAGERAPQSPAAPLCPDTFTSFIFGCPYVKIPDAGSDLDPGDELPSGLFAPGKQILRLETGWWSKSLDEGRSTLPKGGKFWVNPQFHLGGFLLAATYTTADSINRQSGTLHLSYDFKIGDLTITPWFQEEFNITDNEEYQRPALSLVYELPRNWQIAATGRFDSRNSGKFYEFWIQREIPLTTKWIIYSRLTYGVNGGWVDEASSGSNHFQHTTVLAYLITRDLRLNATYSWVIPLSALRKADYNTTNAFGVSLSLSY